MADAALPDFRRLDYLAQGSEDQRRARAVLVRHDLLGRLAPLDAALAGTVPLDIQGPGSDLDILVTAPAEPAALIPRLDAMFGTLPDYRRRLADFIDGPALVAGFTLEGGPVEIFAQALPVERQMAWRHMRVEARLLALFPAAKAAIRSLKAAGLKTEPAFAALFNLPGDPYQALLGLENRLEVELKALELNDIQKFF
ncbi:DUF4269 domain-containing protein [Niveispirillum sp. SYP-B3756]|uniref:DUF4269 domain-containing protein n=1 Tax=Niveispirillum sp. SYP-B3756 TaxID=2662178 RepID=UPI001291089A|nr:DUF4269 domain-containing protein [Niveispirillum sp. SYP-B3756]MQP67981.1 DUF4269 domain-containing protein [Niveispirillum sp. SYP-B3756]